MNMVRTACTLMALLLLLVSGASAARMCACLDALASEAKCCQKPMPCCDQGACAAHDDSSLHADLALDAFKAFEMAAALPFLRELPLAELYAEPAAKPAPRLVRVRGPDIGFHALRAPPAR
jgi:hypothetical protein